MESTDPKYAVHSGSLYVSDTYGFRFNPTLDSVTTVNNWWDVDIIYFLQGSYLSNVIEYKDEDASIYNPFSVQQKTMISFNEGRDWNVVKPPTIDSLGNVINCTVPTGRVCSLNLFGSTTWIGSSGYHYGWFYSEPGAVGLVLSTGNVGDFLRYEKSQVNTFMSRDGGITWKEVFKGSTRYTFADSGGIVVAMPHGVVKRCFLVPMMMLGVNANTILLLG